MKRTYIESTVVFDDGKQDVEIIGGRVEATTLHEAHRRELSRFWGTFKSVDPKLSRFRELKATNTVAALIEASKPEPSNG